jgi:Cys-rich four helix bundle protein (predicted Tat secretion target)
MNRRDLMSGATATVVAALSAAAMAEEATTHQHHHMGHSPYQGLIDTSSDCLVKGQACVAHCLVLLGDGDKEMAACAQSVSQILELCGALQGLAIQQSSYVPALAKIALDACQACEKECRKHENKHAECKACAESCANCAKECKAVAA